MTPDEARKAAERTRVEAEAARTALIHAIETSWTERATEIVAEAVLNQPEVTRGKDVADLAVFKANMALTVESAARSVESLFATVLDIDELASHARKNAYGNVRPALSEPLRKLGQPLHDLIESAGYSTRPLKQSRNEYASGSFGPGDLKLDIREQENVYAQAAEKYGKALITLEEVERSIAVEEARTLWESL